MSLNEEQLNGRRALVCGASKGIGRSVAEELASRGAEIVLLARDEELLKSLVGSLSGGARHSYLAVDLSDEQALVNGLSRELERGPITIVLNNSAGPKGGPLIEAEAASLKMAFQNHVISAHLILQLLVPGMMREKFGRIVNIISTSVKVPIVGLGVSNTVRGAMASWAKTMANELGGYGITVNNILPGFTDTNRLAELKRQRAAATQKSEEDVLQEWLRQIPAGRIGAPHEVAKAVAFLCSQGASYINGINLPVDGGRTGSL